MQKSSMSIGFFGMCFLGACGGGGVSEAPIVPFASFAEGVSVGDEIFDSDPQLDISFPTDVPVSGTATFDGAILLELDPFTGSIGAGGVSASVRQTSTMREEVVGTARINVDFLANSFDGEAGNFINDNDQMVDGSLAVSNGVVDRGIEELGIDTVLRADVTGTVDFSSGTQVIDANADGFFAGPDANVIDMGFRSTVDDGTGNDATLSGIIIAERGPIQL